MHKVMKGWYVYKGWNVMRDTPEWGMSHFPWQINWAGKDNSRRHFRTRREATDWIDRLEK